MGEMRELLGAAQRAAVTPVFLVFLGALFVYVMTRNYLRFRREKLVPELIEGEQLLDELDVAGPFVTKRTMLTNRRVVQLRLQWLFSRRKQFSIAFEDIQTVVSRRGAKRWLFLAALVFVGSLNPVALLLLLWGLEAKTYSILFDTPRMSMPFTWITAETSERRQLSDFDRFYRNAHAIWARVRTEKALAPPKAAASQVVETDFAWGVPVWAYVSAFLVLGLLQRLTEQHLSFDDYVFGPLYLALPVAVASRSRRDALWTALVGPVALLTVKFPRGGLAGLLAGDGTSPRFGEYIVLLFTVIVMTAIASLIVERLHRSAGFVAVILWLGFAALAAPAAFLSLGLYCKTLLAMAWSIALARVERAIGHQYGAA